MDSTLNPIIPDKTSLITPGLAGVMPASVHQALVRYNLRKAAEEDPAVLERCLEWQATMDEHGCGGCYDAARPELAARVAS